MSSQWPSKSNQFILEFKVSASAKFNDITASCFWGIMFTMELMNLMKRKKLNMSSKAFLWYHGSFFLNCGRLYTHPPQGVIMHLRVWCYIYTNVNLVVSQQWSQRPYCMLDQVLVWPIRFESFFKSHGGPRFTICFGIICIQTNLRGFLHIQYIVNIHLHMSTQTAALKWSAKQQTTNMNVFFTLVSTNDHIYSHYKLPGTLATKSTTNKTPVLFFFINFLWSADQFLLDQITM